MEDDELPDVFGMKPKFYRFEIVNIAVLIIIGLILILLTFFDVFHVFLGVGLLIIMAGISSMASSINYLKNRTDAPLQEAIKKSFRYRMATGILCFIAGGALLVAYFMSS